MGKNRNNQNRTVVTETTEVETTEEIQSTTEVEETPIEETPEAITEVDTNVEVTTEEEAPEERKASSVEELNQMVQAEGLTQEPTEDQLKEAAELEEQNTAAVVEATTNSKELNNDQLSAIIKLNIPLMEKIDKLITGLPEAGSRLLIAVRSLHNNMAVSKYRENKVTTTSAQRAFTRAFMSLMNDQTQGDAFELSMRYVSWSIKQLMDKKVLDKENLGLVRGSAPISPEISVIFAAGTADKELYSFIYIITMFDFKLGVSSNTEIDMRKASADTLLTEEIVTRFNSFYNNN